MRSGYTKRDVIDAQKGRTFRHWTVAGANTWTWAWDECCSTLMLVANARMYSVTPGVKQAWHDVLCWALERTGLSAEVIDWDEPTLLSALWARGDLACAMMCGLAYSLRAPRPALIAAPIPSPERYQGSPVYFTDIVVRADSHYHALEDTFGGVVGYTLEDSMSGCVALRRHLLPFRSRERAQLYRKAVGGLINARGVIRALEARAIDVGPLDSYYHDLLRQNDPALAATVRVVETTAAAPIPPFVATASLTPPQIEQIRAALLSSSGTTELREQRETLLLAGFVAPRLDDYDEFEAIMAASHEFAEIW